MDIIKFREDLVSLTTKLIPYIQSYGYKKSTTANAYQQKICHAFLDFFNSVLPDILTEFG
jgi:hypothetical protein